jgi:hypothetical protein
MPSLLLLPLGMIVWMVCYGPGFVGRREEGAADWRQAAETTSAQEAELAQLLAVEEPETSRDA